MTIPLLMELGVIWPMHITLELALGVTPISMTQKSGLFIKKLMRVRILNNNLIIGL